MRTLATLLDALPDETVVHPGHMGTRRSAASAPPTRSSPSSREPAGSRHRAARTTCWARRRSRAPTLEAHARRILERAGYRRIETPAFEATELFARGVGESTDVVQKEMYTLAGGDRASRCARRARRRSAAPTRARHAQAGPQPVKLWYLSSFFRRERPQKGRFRQFWQVGRRGDRLRRPGRRRRVDPAARRAARGARQPRRAAADRIARHARDARGVPRRAAGLPARARGASSPPRSSRGSTSTRCAPSTPTTRARARVMAARRGCSTRSPTTTASTSRPCARCSTPPASRTRSTRRSCAGSTTTRARCSSSPPTRSARSRASAAAGATTG